MASGFLKNVSKRRSAKNGDIDDMTAAVHGNEKSLSKDLARKKLHEHKRGMMMFYHPLTLVLEAL